jgi:GntR family transcriptional regulator
LFVRIEPSSGTPIVRQIADQIRAQCASRRLKPGDRLPSMRELAAELAVNQNTILHVYERLTAEGFLERRHGAGTYVRERLPAGQMSAQRQLLQAEVRRLVEKAQTLGLDPDELHAMVDAASQQPLSKEKDL